MGSHGYAHGPVCLLQWGVSEPSAHEGKKPGGAGGLCLGIRTNSSGGAASSGSDAVGSLEAVTLTGGSTLGISDGALPLKVGAIGIPFSHI